VDFFAPLTSKVKKPSSFMIKIGKNTEEIGAINLKK
jgi:hypothetical protein